MIALLGYLLLAPQSFSAFLPGGTRVKLVAVSDSAGKRTWSPSGASFAQIPMPARIVKLTPGAAPHVRLLFAEVGTRKPVPPGVAFQVVGGPVRPAALVHKEGSSRAPKWLAYAIANHRGASAAVRIGVAAGSWKTIGSVTPQGTAGLKRSGIGFLRMARPDAERKNAVVVDVVLPVDPDSQDFRIQVLDRRGKALPFLSSESPQGSALPTRIWFTGRYEVVGHVELQTRPYVWKTFKGVVFDK